ncbi:MAG TPA: hypothetical protein VE954_13120 [Oligoflexus sp.]|uniref:hypothetical protein n=1 Tax=Oligoflexus sp. TaxID=1971216 RepID=UPI002D5AE2F8|nr:hypothetical protein [Oligoflexus sp.]HYX34048.1 hypothetical protein [Oligoflexus sp.]
MRNICLLALLALNALAPQVLAQDDDAELGKPQPTPEAPGSSILDESDEVEPVQPLPPLPPVSTRSAPVVVRDVPEPAPPPPAPAAAEKSQSSGFSLIEGRRRPGATFGFGATRPEKLGKFNHYNYLYGKEKVSPHFYGGYYLFSYLVDFGLVGRVGYYHAEGHPLAARPETPLKRDLVDELKDENQKLGLTLIPTQLALEVAISPFKTRWVVFRGWMGMEYLYVQETIEPDLPSTSTTDTASTYTSSGWNQGIATGVMASFSLTGLDARSDNSLRSLGVDRYYLSFFLENVTTTRDKFGNFDRKNYGIAFSFEGLR